MRTNLRSNKQLIEQLKTSQTSWVDAAIVVAFENRFEFVGEDHPDPVNRLNLLLEQGGIAIGLAGVVPAGGTTGDILCTKVFEEYEGQAFAHRYMDTLQGIVREHDGR